MKTALLLDFDETIFRTHDFWGECWEFWTTHHSPETTAKIDELLKNRKENDAIFAPKQLMSDGEWQLALGYCDIHALRFLHDDTAEFLQKLNREKYQPIVLSYGERDYQAAKLDPLNLGLPAIFLDHRDKTAEISGWRRDGFYEIGGETFLEIILIDDRDISFAGFEKLQKARGFLLNRGSHASKTDFKSLAKNVKVVESFREIVL